MFGVIEEIQRRASANPKKIVFPESDDRRILQAAEAISRHRIASPITLGELARIKDRACQAGIQALHVEVRQPEPRKIDVYANMLAAEWRAQGIREVEARRKLQDPTQYAAAMVRFGDADGLIAGPPAKKREVVSVRAMGLGPKGSMVSRCFLVALPDGDRPKAAGLLFADSGALGTPTASELAEIAIDAGRQTRHLLGCEPHVAFLAFGVIASLETRNRFQSAARALEDRVQRAIATVQARQGSLVVDHRLHTDVPSRRAIVGSEENDAATPNTFVFPDMQVGDLGHRLQALFHGSRVVGPILRGLTLPANEVGAECTVEDIINITAVTALS